MRHSRVQALCKLFSVMLHIMPEASEVLGEKGESMEVHFLPQLVICAGFFLIYFVEELVEMVLGSHHHSENLHR